MKYRIVEKNGEFYPQIKWLLWYWDFETPVSMDENYTFKYDSIEEAKAFIDKRINKKAEGNPQTAIHNHP